MGMGMSFFPSYPLPGGISVPLQTMRTSTWSLSSRDFVRVRSFEAACRLVFVRPALARLHRHMFLVRNYTGTGVAKPDPCLPGLGQGHDGKKDASMPMRLAKGNYLAVSNGRLQFSKG
jgi:hypothetical protein